MFLFMLLLNLHHLWVQFVFACFLWREDGIQLYLAQLQPSSASSHNSGTHSLEDTCNASDTLKKAIQAIVIIDNTGNLTLLGFGQDFLVENELAPLHKYKERLGTKVKFACLDWSFDHKPSFFFIMVFTGCEINLTCLLVFCYFPTKSWKSYTLIHCLIYFLLLD